MNEKRQFWWTMTVQTIEKLHHLAGNFHDDMFAMSGDALTRNTRQ